MTVTCPPDGGCLPVEDSAECWVQHALEAVGAEQFVFGPGGVGVEFDATFTGFDFEGPTMINYTKNTENKE
jgi:hypothetical protein